MSVLLVLLLDDIFVHSALEGKMVSELLMFHRMNFRFRNSGCDLERHTYTSEN